MPRDITTNFIIILRERPDGKHEWVDNVGRQTAVVDYIIENYTYEAEDGEKYIVVDPRQGTVTEYVVQKRPALVKVAESGFVERGGGR